MQLSLTQPRTWALLLPLLSNLLLWENVDSVPVCEVVNGQCQLTLEYLFNKARELSENTNRLTSEMFNEFEEHYALGPAFQDKIPLLCYNYSLSVPDNRTEDQEIEPEVLLKVTIGMLAGWNNTLSHEIADIADLESIPGVGAFLSKVREVFAKFTGLTTLLKEVKSLLNLAHLESEEDEDYPPSGVPYLHLLNKSSRLVFYHALLGCLNYDAEKVDTHIKILRCKMVLRKC